jgi:hypothetical protein
MAGDSAWKDVLWALFATAIGVLHLIKRVIYKYVPGL